MIDYDDVLFQCEKRTYGRGIAYLIICGCRKENGNFETFISECLGTNVKFIQERVLAWDNCELRFEWQAQKSEYVD